MLSFKKSLSVTGGITFNGKSALEKKCEVCGKVIAEKVDGVTTMEGFININDKIYHNDCYDDYQITHTLE